jgi:hypothetical protein
MVLDQTSELDPFPKTKSVQHFFKLEVHRLPAHIRELHNEMLEYKKAYEQARRDFEDAIYNK